MSVDVLIVEDEFLIALQLEDILATAGHRVIGIVCDRAALSQVREAPQVALVDLNLRDGPSGLSIAQDLALKHGTAILYVTANPNQIVEPAPTAVGVVQKPFSPPSILAAIALAAGLDGGGAKIPSDINLFSRSMP